MYVKYCDSLIISSVDEIIKQDEKCTWELKKYASNNICKKL